jgi:hypothetical protein
VLVSAAVYLIAAALGIVLIAAAVGAVIAALALLVRLAVKKRRAILITPAAGLPSPAYHNDDEPTQPQEIIMGRADPLTTIRNWSDEQIAQLPPRTRARVGELKHYVETEAQDERFLRITELLPVGAVFEPKDPASGLRARIISVDHRWSGESGDPPEVIVTFEHINSGHHVIWPAQTFLARWILSEEVDF